MKIKIMREWSYLYNLSILVKPASSFKWFLWFCITFGLIGIVASPASVIAASATETDITFDDLFHGSVVGIQYQNVGGQDLGVVFPKENDYYQPIVTTVPIGQAQSGTQVGNISCNNPFEPTAPECSVEFPYPSTLATFTQKRQYVRVYVGEFSKPDGTPFKNQNGSPVTAHVSLTALDTNNNTLGSVQSAIVTSGAGFHTALEVDLSTADIAAIKIEGDQLALIGIDDLTFDTPVTQGLPDFDLTETPIIQRAPGIVPIAGSLIVPITINRLNGSIGPIQFSITGLPPNVSASFAPSVSTGTSTTLTIMATPDAQSSTTATITITGTPGAPSVGSAPHKLIIVIKTENNFSISISDSPNISLPCFTPDPGVYADPGDFTHNHRRVSKTINLTRGLSFIGTVNLAITTSVPPDMQVSFSPSSIPIGAGNLVDTSTLTIITPPPYTTTGDIILHVVAQSGSLPISSVDLNLNTDTCSSPPPFNLVWTTIDPNGFPFNPIWSYQAYSPDKVSLPDTVVQCPGMYKGPADGVFYGSTLYLGQPSCTTQNITTNSATGLFDSNICQQGRSSGNWFTNFISSIVGDWFTEFYDATLRALKSFFGEQFSNDGGFRGHINYFPATVEGLVSFNDQSSDYANDGDTSLNLKTNTGVGPELLNAGKPANDGEVHLEFDARETRKNFTTAWWKQVNQAIDNGSNAAARSMIDGHYARVTGLIGFDTVHTIAAESHPVYAMAIHEQSGALSSTDPTDDGWAIFARNWGNEGYCSSINLPIPSEVITVEIPWLPGATKVEVIQNVTSFEYFVNGSKNISYNLSYITDRAVFISFNLGSADAHPLIDGDLHLKWTFPNPAAYTRVPPTAFSNPELESPDGIEEKLNTYYAKLTPKQLATLTAAQVQPQIRQSFLLQNPLISLQLSDSKLLNGTPYDYLYHMVGIRDIVKGDQDRRDDSVWCVVFNGNIPGASRSLCSLAYNPVSYGPNWKAIGLMTAVLILLIGVFILRRRSKN